MQLALTATAYGAYVIGGALQAIRGFTDGLNCDGSNTYSMRFNNTVTFADHTFITFIKNKGQLDEQTINVTSSTLSPNQTIDYNVPAWTVALVAGDTVHYNVSLGTNYADGDLNGPLLAHDNFNRTGTLNGTVPDTLDESLNWSDTSLRMEAFNGYAAPVSTSTTNHAFLPTTFANKTLTFDYESDVAAIDPMVGYVYVAYIGTATHYIRALIGQSGGTGFSRFRLEKRIGGVATTTSYGNFTETNGAVVTNITMQVDFVAGLAYLWETADKDGTLHTLDISDWTEAPNVNVGFGGSAFTTLPTRYRISDFQVTDLSKAGTAIVPQQLEITNCLNAQAANGLPAFPSGDANSIILATLLTSGDIDAGSNQGGGQTFDAINGMESGTVAGISWTKAAQVNLEAGGMVRWEIEKDWFDEATVPVADEYNMSFAVGWGQLKDNANGQMVTRPHISFAGNNYSEISLLGKPDNVEVAIYWTPTNTFMVMDGLPLIDLIEVDTLVGRFSPIVIGGDRTLSNRGAHGFRNRNFEAISTVPQFPAHPLLGDILFQGDSITIRGNLPYSMIVPKANRYNVIWFSPGLGFAAGGVLTPATPGLFKDAGYQCTFFRTLFKSKRLIPSSNCNNIAASGENVAQCLVRTNTFYDVDGLSTQMVNLMIGTNDAQKSTPLTAQQIIDFRTNYQAILTKHFNEGVRRVNIMQVPTLSTHASFTQAMNDNVDVVNGVVREMAAWAAGQGYGNNFVGTGDLFTALGGHTNYQPYFTAGDIHPNAEGHIIIGDLFSGLALAVAETFN